MSRAERRRAERERKKREKMKKKEGLRKITRGPWNEDSPKCPNCGADWKDEGDKYSCYECGRFSMKTDLNITDCERCGLQFLWDNLEAWIDDEEYDEHLLCSDCLDQVLFKGDQEWLKIKVDESDNVS